MHIRLWDSPFVLDVGCFLPERLDQLSHVLGVLFVDSRQLVVEVAHCKTELSDCSSLNQRQPHLA